MYELERILELVADERGRQEGLARRGIIPRTCASLESSNIEKLPILAEEFGEVAHALNEKDIENLFEELIQVAAVAVGWAQAIYHDRQSV